jgi:radical S-adenosyl methionine domain-containing protein 2
MIDLTEGFLPGRVIDVVNWHITPRCGYNCKFCNVHNCYFEIRDMKYAEKNLQQLKELEEQDFHIKTLNIAGGDPLLHPYLFDLLKMGNEKGFNLWITTNGTLLNEKNLDHLSNYVDGISVSVDCICNVKQKKIGRGYGNHVTDILRVSDMIHETGLKLGVKTLVTKINQKDNLHALLHRLSPHQWNVYQTLPCLYQNDHLKSIEVSEEVFFLFSRRHSHLRFGPCNEPHFWSKNDMIKKYYFLVDGTIRTCW